MFAASVVLRIVINILPYTNIVSITLQNCLCNKANSGFLYPFSFLKGMEITTNGVTIFVLLVTLIILEVGNISQFPASPASPVSPVTCTVVIFTKNMGVVPDDMFLQFL